MEENDGDVAANRDVEQLDGDLALHHLVESDGKVVGVPGGVHHVTGTVHVHVGPTSVSSSGEQGDGLDGDGVEHHRKFVRQDSVAYATHVTEYSNVRRRQLRRLTSPHTKERDYLFLCGQGFCVQEQCTGYES